MLHNRLKKIDPTMFDAKLYKKNLIDIKTYFTIKNEIEKSKVLFL